jgi:hypothetical protein
MPKYATGQMRYSFILLIIEANGLKSEPLNCVFYTVQY